IAVAALDAPDLTVIGLSRVGAVLEGIKVAAIILPLIEIGPLAHKGPDLISPLAKCPNTPISASQRVNIGPGARGERQTIIENIGDRADTNAAVIVQCWIILCLWKPKTGVCCRLPIANKGAVHFRRIDNRRIGIQTQE